MTARPESLRFAGNRLPREMRMARRRDFERAYRLGGRARGSLLTVVAAANQLPYPRVGLSVGRRIWKTAVGRNRVRRVLREAFRLSRRELPPGFDLVLIPAAPRLDPALEAVRRELVRLAWRAAERARARTAEAPALQSAPAAQRAASEPPVPPPQPGP